ncbi:hypothetical protein [Paraburkholderia humisilvae]
MTMREADRLKVIEAVTDGRLKPGKAAERLGLTVRQVEPHSYPAIRYLKSLWRTAIRTRRGIQCVEWNADREPLDAVRWPSAI